MQWWGRYYVFCIKEFSLFFRIRIFVYIDETFAEDFDGNNLKLIRDLLYGRIGLQRTFNLKGLELHVNFEIIGTNKLRYKTFPSKENIG